MELLIVGSFTLQYILLKYYIFYPGMKVEKCSESIKFIGKRNNNKYLT